MSSATGNKILLSDSVRSEVCGMVWSQRLFCVGNIMGVCIKVIYGMYVWIAVELMSCTYGCCVILEKVSKIYKD